jgi:hypothetical protein
VRPKTIQSNLTVEAVREIRKRHAQGEKLDSIAHSFRIGSSAVCMIAKRKRRADVKDL